MKINNLVLGSLTGLALLTFGGSMANSQKAHADNVIYTNEVVINGGNNTIKSNKPTKATTYNTQLPQSAKPIKHINLIKSVHSQPRANHKMAKKVTNNVWHNGVPSQLSSVNGWLSNPEFKGLKNPKHEYVRYTTPLYTTRGFNARPHFYRGLKYNLNQATGYGRTVGVVNSDKNPYYKELGHNKFAIISGNLTNGLNKDLFMVNHPKSKKFIIPNYVTIEVVKHGNIKIWNHHKLVGTFHKMSNSEAHALGY